MNILAHILLSGENEGVIIGNFIADSIKGKNYSQFPEDVIKGILLHRKIDEFTDCHPVFISSKARLRPVYKKYAGVIADIFYDHYLAVGWKNYMNVPLPEYANQVYKLINNNINWLPAQVQEFLPYMISGNWLANYAKEDGIRRTLEGMSRRAKFDSNMHLAINDLIKDYKLYESEFREFFPEVKQFAHNTLLSL